MKLISLLAAMALVTHWQVFSQDISAAFLAFARLWKGDKVVDLMPGSHYFTALFSTLVGEQGRVYALQPREMDKSVPDSLQRLRVLAHSTGLANISVMPEPVQLVWTSKNYHDLHVPFMGVGDIARVNRAIDPSS